MAGTDGATDFLVRTNLLGAYHCLEEAKRHRAQVLFLSTSRVYPVAALNSLAYVEEETRFALLDEQALTGASARGVSEAFPLEGARTLYGASKLCAELLIAEYAESFGLRTVIDRCGVVAGPWQMGKVDQGVFTHWMMAHYFDRPLSDRRVRRELRPAHGDRPLRRRRRPVADGEGRSGRIHPLDDGPLLRSPALRSPSTPRASACAR